MPELCWKHHALIQALLTRGPLVAEEFYELFEGVTGRKPGTRQANLNEYLLKINKELSYVQFELRGCVNQYDGQLYYGVVNNVADEQSKLGTKYTGPQIAFFKGIIEALMQEGGGQGTISNISALNIRLENQVPTESQSQPQAQSQGDVVYSVPTAFKNFTISQKEKALHELVVDRWLCCTPTGDIGLGVRSFLDLRSWFRGNDVPVCEFCNEAGIKVEFCPNEECSVRIHEYCLIQKFSQTKASKTCPGCGHSWPFTVPKAENLENWDEPNDPTQAPANGDNSQRKSRRNHTANDPNDAGPSEPSDRKKPKRNNSDHPKNAKSSQASSGTSLRRSTRHMR
ncbi:hypothetical protein V2J09_011847 [Rumex salicifolius]